MPYFFTHINFNSDLKFNILGLAISCAKLERESERESERERRICRH